VKLGWASDQEGRSISTLRLNDLVDHATAWLAEGDVSPHDVSIRLNDILFSALAPSKSDGYGRRRDSFLKLVENSGS
jgi:hypothetical protein